MKTIFSVLLMCCASFVFADKPPVYEETDGNPKLHTGFCINSSEEDDQNKFDCCYSSWPREKIDFGIEKIFARFPQRPATSQSNSLLTAYAYDHNVMYALYGYFPPVGNIDPNSFFDEILYQANNYPYNLVNHTTRQISNGDWVMDYVMHDYTQNLIIKSRVIVTHFNAYTLQCVEPNGVRDYFDYFLNHFSIKSDLPN